MASKADHIFIHIRIYIWSPRTGLTFLDNLTICGTMPSWAYCYLEAARTRFPFPDEEDPPDAMDMGGLTFN